MERIHREGRTLYSAVPPWPTVTTWMLAFVPSGKSKPLGRSTSGKHNVPLPVSFRGWGVKEMLKLVAFDPRPRLMKKYVDWWWKPMLREPPVRGHMVRFLPDVDWLTPAPTTKFVLAMPQEEWEVRTPYTGRCIAKQVQGMNHRASMDIRLKNEHMTGASGGKEWESTCFRLLCSRGRLVLVYIGEFGTARWWFAGAVGESQPGP